MMRNTLVALLVGAAALLVPAAARAQGSISGLVADSTGGILPGVTVAAASPVNIEGIITAVSDSSGRYTIINLRPGPYTVTFTLPGFSTVVYEDILLVGDASVQVNAQLQVGALEETVTVSGESPLVDVQQARRQAVVTQEMMDTLPTARNFEARALLVPGVRNTGLGEGQYWPTVHGSEAGDALTLNDGMRANSIIDDGNYKIGWEMNDAATAELTFETGGAPAEMQVGGMVMNAIPKEGGNQLSGTWFNYYGNGNLQSDNRGDLADQIQVGNKLDYSIDTNVALGGPIMRDKLWFFTSYRYFDNKNLVADQFFKPAGTVSRLGRDVTFDNAGEQAYNRAYDSNGLIRLTYQISARDKFRLGFERNNTFAEFANVTADRPPEASNVIPQPAGKHINGRYTSTLSSRLLVEAGYALQYNRWRRHEHEAVRGLPATYDLSTGVWGGGYPTRGWQREQRHHIKGSLSYVTGSHNFKTGIDQTWGWLDLGTHYQGDVQTLYFVDGAPLGVNVLAAPLGNFGGEISRDLGVYAQDSWTVNRLTLNLGARFDHFKAQIPEQAAPAGTWVPARSFPSFPGPTWNNVSVRLGFAYDLRGDGRTALKANASQFVAGEGTRLTMLRNPMASQTWAPNSEFRSWNDLDGNLAVVDDVSGAVQFEEVGPSPNVNFGQAADTTLLDPDLRREQHWEYSVSLQHELFSGFSVTGGFYRRDYYNLQYEDNLATTHDDYDRFFISGPVDPRLPNGGGEMIELYNLDPAKFGLSDKYVGNSDINDRIYTGFEFQADLRLPGGGFLGGSFTTERTEVNDCEVDNPNSLRFCHVVPPFQTMYKAHGSYPVPGGMTASFFLQGYPGPDLNANYSVDSTIAGRTLTGGQRIAIDLVESESEFLDFQTQLDVRLMRAFDVGGVRYVPLIDLYNIFNVNTITSITEAYGSRWLNPAVIVRPRFLRLGLEVEW